MLNPVGLFFFWHKGCEAALWAALLFAFSVGAALRHRTLRQAQWAGGGWLSAASALDCKKCDRKKQQKGWLLWKSKKDRECLAKYI